MKKGITIAGNITVDHNKYIDVFPEEGTLVAINKVSKSYGGAVSNTAINLALIDPNTYISVAGNIGDDHDAEDIINYYKSYNLDTKDLKKVKGYLTAQTDSFINLNNHKRTFFVNMAVSNIYGKDEISCKTTHFHIGYLLLLPFLDEVITKGKTRLSVLLKEMSNKGIITSADLVSEESSRYIDVVVPSLPFLNYLIINEIEASRTANVDIYNKDGSISIKKVKEAAEVLKEMGIKNSVVIHAPEFGLIYDGHTYTILPSLELDKNFIISSVGAGDGFCAGILYGILNDYSDYEKLRLASCVAAGVLNSHKPQANIKGLNHFLSLERFGRKELKEI